MVNADGEPGLVRYVQLRELELPQVENWTARREDHAHRSARSKWIGYLQRQQTPKPMAQEPVA